MQWSSAFESWDGTLYVSKDTPSATRDSLVMYLAKAEERNKQFWQGKEGKPKIIYVHTPEQHARYAWPQAPASVFYTPFQCIMIIGPEGIDLDVMSHELCHTELYHRLGWWRREWQIPTWFDEGLAMQLDYRKEYNEAAYVDLLSRLDYFPDIKTKRTPKAFWETGLVDSRQHYILARHEVGQWLHTHQRTGLLNMIGQMVEHGRDFEELYGQ
ncbi:MAG: hypothetical protein AAFO94_13845 [Bacteroidota bacterium]